MPAPIKNGLHIRPGVQSRIVDPAEINRGQAVRRRGNHGKPTENLTIEVMGGKNGDLRLSTVKMIVSKEDMKTIRKTHHFANGTLKLDSWVCNNVVNDLLDKGAKLGAKLDVNTGLSTGKHDLEFEIGIIGARLFHARANRQDVLEEYYEHIVREARNAQDNGKLADAINICRQARGAKPVVAPKPFNPRPEPESEIDSLPPLPSEHPHMKEELPGDFFKAGNPRNMVKDQGLVPPPPPSVSEIRMQLELDTEAQKGLSAIITWAETYPELQKELGEELNRARQYMAEGRLDLVKYCVSGAEKVIRKHQLDYRSEIDEDAQSDSTMWSLYDEPENPIPSGPRGVGQPDNAPLDSVPGKQLDPKSVAEAQLETILNWACDQHENKILAEIHRLAGEHFENGRYKKVGDCFRKADALMRGKHIDDRPTNSELSGISGSWSSLDLASNFSGLASKASLPDSESVSDSSSSHDDDDVVRNLGGVTLGKPPSAPNVLVGHYEIESASDRVPPPPPIREERDTSDSKVAGNDDPLPSVDGAQLLRAARDAKKFFEETLLSDPISEFGDDNSVELNNDISLPQNTDVIRMGDIPNLTGKELLGLVSNSNVEFFDAVGHDDEESMSYKSNYENSVMSYSEYMKDTD